MPSTAQLLRLARDAAPSSDSRPADTELLQRYVAARDEAAFAELVRRNGPLVLRACRHTLGEASADDGFQATFLLLVRSARGLTRPGSLAGWLHAAAVRIAANARRGEERRRKRERARPIRSTSPDDLTWREVREVLDREIAALPERHRLPVILCHILELSHEEAARRAGCSIGALRGRLESGKDQLRKRLARHGLPMAAPALVLGAPPPVSAGLVEATIAAVRSGMSGTIPPALVGLLRPIYRIRMALLIAPTAVVLAVVGTVLGTIGPEAEPPKVAAPEQAKPAGDPVRRIDLFGDPLPDGVLLRLGTTRSRANIAGFGILSDGTVITVSPFVEVSIWPPKADRPSETVRLLRPFGPKLPPFDPRPAVSPDGRYVAANTDDKLLVVWERKDGEFKEAMKFDLPASRLVFSPGGTRLAAGTRICDLRTGKYHDLDDMGHLEAVAFSGDSKRFAGTNGYTAAVWDVESGKKLAGYKTGRVRYRGIALDRTGSVMAVSPTWEPETVVFVDPMTGASIPKLTSPEKFRCLWANFATDGRTVLLGDRTGVTWWDPGAGKLIRRFEGMAHGWNGGWDLPARLSPDGKVLVGTSTRMLLRWDAATGQPLLPESHEAGHHPHHRYRRVARWEMDRHRRLGHPTADLGHGNWPAGRNGAGGMDVGHTQPRLQPRRPFRVRPQFWRQGSVEVGNRDWPRSVAVRLLPGLTSAW